jgi:hypothetical protein
MSAKLPIMGTIRTSEGSNDPVIPNPEPPEIPDAPPPELAPEPTQPEIQEPPAAAHPGFRVARGSELPGRSTLQKYEWFP